MASVADNTKNGEQLARETIAPRASSRGKSPVKQPPSKKTKKLPDNCSAVQAGKKRRREKSLTKSAPRKSKGSKKRRSKSRRYSSSDSSAGSSFTSESSSSSESESDNTRPSRIQKVNDTSPFSRPSSPENETYVVSDEIVEYAAAAAFEGLSKSARKAMARATPVPFHEDLRPKKVDSFVKKFLKRKGANFNSIADRRQLNLAGRILDPLGPLSHLWQTALQAQNENTGVDPTAVVEATQRAMLLIGNASHCALVDRRKGLLAKVSPETLDLVDDSELFIPGSCELFGKKFKKAVLKDLKLSKEMDSLVSASRLGNSGKQQFKQPFRGLPGKGPGYNSRAWNQRRWVPSQSRYRSGFSQQGGKAKVFPQPGKQN